MEFQCLLCPKAYKHKSSLKRHANQVHYQKTPYKCSQSFVHRSELEQHFQSRHATSAPFNCFRCGLSFKLKKNLNRHHRSMKCQQTVSYFFNDTFI